jgi:hypothetical protein
VFSDQVFPLLLLFVCEKKEEKKQDSSVNYAKYEKRALSKVDHSTRQKLKKSKKSMIFGFEQNKENNARFTLR